MKIIGKSYSLLMFPMIVAVLFMTEYIVEKIFADENYYQEQWWPIVLGFFISGVAVHLMNVKINGDDYMQKAPNKEYGKFYLINLKYWTIILPIIGIVFGIIIFFENR